MKLVNLCFACICSSFMYIKAEEEPEGIDDQGGNPEEVYNKTYREYHTYLEIALFTEYTNSRRPVRTFSTSTNVTVHFDIHHVSINQNEQTMTVYGMVLMKWLDEFLGWDPQDFNGIELISCPEWRVWRPKIRVANSASGVFSNYEVASYAHVLVKTLGKEMSFSPDRAVGRLLFTFAPDFKDSIMKMGPWRRWRRLILSGFCKMLLQAMLSMYPLFSAKVGCNLDFSTFPEDAHSCTVSFFTKQSMNEVRLAALDDMAPTVNLGWDAQSNKRIISDFEILNISSELFYYRNGDTTALEPSKNELSSAWSVLQLTVQFRRHSAIFGVCVLLPSLVLVTFNILPFFLPCLQHSVYVLVTNIIMQAIFLQKFINSMPLSAEKVPKSVLFYSLTMWFNMFSLMLHILLVIADKQLLTISTVRCTLMALEKAIAVRLPYSSRTPIATLRATAGVFILVFYTLLMFAFLI